MQGRLKYPKYFVNHSICPAFLENFIAAVNSIPASLVAYQRELFSPQEKKIIWRLNISASIFVPVL
jgi:hypothetical protein